jgi:hypothetical protein
MASQVCSLIELSRDSPDEISCRSRSVSARILKSRDGLMKCTRTGGQFTGHVSVERSESAYHDVDRRFKDARERTNMMLQKHTLASRTDSRCASVQCFLPAPA